MRRWYEHKLLSLQQADRLLAISASAAGELREHRKEIAAEKIVTVSSGYNRFFSPGRSHPLQWRRYGIVRPYLMHVGVYGKRKNFEGLIRAFALLPKRLQKRYQLLLVCKADKKRHRYLRKEAARCSLPDDALVLTDYLPDRELRMLYRGAALFVFPSLHEGFGLPPLEAMACGTATVAGNKSSLPEVLQCPKALFDASSPRKTAQMLSSLLTSYPQRRKLTLHALKQVKKFSWEQTASRVLYALEIDKR
jgi:glycosyltransferase involved in cell wall biosynthesis